MVELYSHSPVHLHGVVLNQLSRGITLPCLVNMKAGNQFCIMLKVTSLLHSNNLLTAKSIYLPILIDKCLFHNYALCKYNCQPLYNPARTVSSRIYHHADIHPSLQLFFSSTVFLRGCARACRTISSVITSFYDALSIWTIFWNSRMRETLPRQFSGATVENHYTFKQDSRCVGPDSNWAPPEYNARLTKRLNKFYSDKWNHLDTQMHRMSSDKEQVVTVCTGLSWLRTSGRFFWWPWRVFVFHSNSWITTECAFSLPLSLIVYILEQVGVFLKVGKSGN
jgi:hypothetical protein